MQVRVTTRCAALGLAALVACSPGDDTTATEPQACDHAGSEQVAVITQITFSRATDGVSRGFDLDGVTSTANGATGCGVGDYVDPEGNPGIDNGFAPIIPALELTEAAAVEGLVQQAINDGSLLLLVTLSDLDDPVDDACVDVALERGIGPPLVGSDGYLLSGQTFDRDTSIDPVNVPAVALTDGRLVATGITMSLPLTIFDVSLQLELTNARLEVDLGPDGTMTGLLTGGTDTSYLVTIASSDNVDAALAGILEGLLAGAADLDPDSDGTCDQISIGFELVGTSAFFFAPDAA